MGNHIFNTTVYKRSPFFEKLFKPRVKEFNLSDRRIGSKYMVMSILEVKNKKFRLKKFT